MKKDQNKDSGFTLVELVIIIAIMMILAGAIGISIIRYIEKARKTKLLQEARAIYDQCSIAIADMDQIQYYGKNTDKHGTILTVDDGLNKTDPNLGKCGRISNESCNNETGSKPLSKVESFNSYVDQYMAKTIVETLPAFSKNKYASKSPNNKYVKDLEYNRYSFMCIYNDEGCLYVEMYYQGYFIHYTPETTLDDIINTKGREDKIKFTNVTN